MCFCLCPLIISLRPHLHDQNSVTVKFGPIRRAVGRSEAWVVCAVGEQPGRELLPGGSRGWSPLQPFPFVLCCPASSRTLSPSVPPGGSASCSCPSSRGQSVHSGKRTPEGEEGCWGTGLKWRLRKRLGESLYSPLVGALSPAAEAAGPVKRQEGLGKGSPPSELALISRPAFAEGLTCKGNGGPCSAT